jgi:hypothetical protein
MREKTEDYEAENCHILEIMILVTNFNNLDLLYYLLLGTRWGAWYLRDGGRGVKGTTE